MNAALARIVTSALTIGVTSCVSSPSALAAPPTQLYGKSIAIRWSEDWHNKTVGGEEKEMNVNNDLGIYVSASGRLFKRFVRVAHGFGGAGSHGAR